MKHYEPIAHSPAELHEVAKQAEVELTILLAIEQSLRVALQWMTRGRGNSHKLSRMVSLFGRAETGDVLSSPS